jgi:hypothetical protein
MLKHSLVTITSKDGAQVPIPHIGGRTPQTRIEVPQHVARSISEQGLQVEVHVKDYVKEDAHAAALTAAKSAAAKPAADDPIRDDKVQTPAFGLPEADPGPAAHDPHSPVSPPAHVVLADGAPPPPEPPPAPAAGAGSAAHSPTRTPVTVAVAPAPAPEHSEPEETLGDLRAKVEGLKTIADAQALVKEYGIELGENPPTTLKGIKQAVLDIIDDNEKAGGEPEAPEAKAAEPEAPDAAK